MTLHFKNISLSHSKKNIYIQKLKCYGFLYKLKFQHFQIYRILELFTRKVSLFFS